jgi:hypothetical protein
VLIFRPLSIEKTIPAPKTTLKTDQNHYKTTKPPPEWSLPIRASIRQLNPGIAHPPKKSRLHLQNAPNKPIFRPLSIENPIPAPKTTLKTDQNHPKVTNPPPE